MRIRSNRNVNIVAFYQGSGDSPVWIAKTSTHPSGIASLDAEMKALTSLGACTSLSVPRVLEWDDDKEHSCLIQTGVPGEPRAIVLSTHARAVPIDLRRAVAWLDEWQRVSPNGLPPLTISALLEKLSGGLETSSSPHLRSLGNHLARLSRVSSGSAIPVHGDLWAQNLLYTDRALSIIDWDGLTRGFPGQDLFFLLSTSTWICNSRVLPFAEACEHLFFSRNTVSEFLSETVRRWSLTPLDVQCAFYGFLAAKMVDDTFTEKAQIERLIAQLDRKTYPAPLVPLV